MMPLEDLRRRTTVFRQPQSDEQMIAGSMPDEHGFSRDWNNVPHIYVGRLFSDLSECPVACFVEKNPVKFCSDGAYRSEEQVFQNRLRKKYGDEMFNLMELSDDTYLPAVSPEVIGKSRNAVDREFELVLGHIISLDPDKDISNVAEDRGHGRYGRINGGIRTLVGGIDEKNLEASPITIETSVPVRSFAGYDDCWPCGTTVLKGVLYYNAHLLGDKEQAAGFFNRNLERRAEKTGREYMVQPVEGIPYADGALSPKQTQTHLPSLDTPFDLAACLKE